MHIVTNQQGSIIQKKTVLRKIALLLATLYINEPNQQNNTNDNADHSVNVDEHITIEECRKAIY